MLHATPNKKAEFQSLLPSVTANMDDWQIASLRLPGGSADDMAALAQRLLTIYGDREGLVITYPERVLMVQKINSNSDSAAFKAELEQKLAGRGYTYTIRQVNPQSLQQLQENFIERDTPPDDSLFRARLAREENHILVIDDDFFYRALMQKECENYATVHQSEDGKDAARLYADINPDIVFLDIHLPSTQGLSILEVMTGMDFEAHVVMLSSDTSKHNVLQAVKKGAAGILKKPPEAVRLMRIFRTCPTFKKAGEQKEAAKV